MADMNSQLVQIIEQARKEYAEDFTDHSENEYIAEALLNAGVRLCPETNTQEYNISVQR